MNWTNDKSLRLSRFCVCLFAVLLAGVLVTIPLWLPYAYDFKFFTGHTMREMRGWVFAVLAGTGACAALALWHLYGLLRAIGRGEVFCKQNVARLRMLSWCCLVAGLCFVSGCWYAPSLLLLSAAAAFMGLILRVIKNVFAQALELKTENDFTI